MANYELPWNPNRLEQRIGRIHRYGQDKEVKVWNFLFDDTRESEIFELLQNKVEEIRSKLGNTADMLGMLDDVDVDSLIMESIQSDEPPGVTREELEDLIDERQRTLEEWYERSLVDTYLTLTRRTGGTNRDMHYEVQQSGGDVWYTWGLTDELARKYLTDKISKKELMENVRATVEQQD